MRKILLIKSTNH